MPFKLADLHPTTQLQGLQAQHIACRSLCDIDMSISHLLPENWQ